MTKLEAFRDTLALIKIEQEFAYNNDNPALADYWAEVYDSMYSIYR